MYSSIIEIEADIQRCVSDFYAKHLHQPDTIIMSEPLIEYVDAWYNHKRSMINLNKVTKIPTSYILQYMAMDVVIIPGKDQGLWFDLGTRNRRESKWI